jgi:hypothetical protein
MAFTIQPIDVKCVNTFIDIPAFTVVNKAANSLYFILQISDGFGTRRYVPTVGQAVTLGFVKSRPANAQSVATLITKIATNPFVGDNSMMKVELTAEESSLLITGGLTLTVGGVAYAMNNIVKKISGEPGF